MATIRSAFIYRVFKPEIPEEKKERYEGIVDIPLNIGPYVLDIWRSDYHILVCTTSGVECLNERTLDSEWYFTSEIIKSTCYNGDKVCFGTISSGVYYNAFPSETGYLEDFLSSCSTISGTVSDNIVCIHATASGFFIGDDGGINNATLAGSVLTVDCKKPQVEVNSVAYSENTETFYWSTVGTVYASDTCISGGFTIKSTFTPGYDINSINVEYLDEADVLYVSTTDGIFKIFSPSCSGTITDKDIVSSDYGLGTCIDGVVYAGSDEDLLKINVLSGEFETFFVDAELVEILYYQW